MATYLFDNYITSVGILNGEFIDPIIIPNEDTILTNETLKQLSCDIKIQTPNGSFVGSRFENMPRLDLNGNTPQGWDDTDLLTMINVKLQEFLVS